LETNDRARRQRRQGRFGGILPGLRADHSPEINHLTAELGVDLARHRSRLLGRADVEAAEAIFVMDMQNYRDLRRLYPQAAGKTYLIGLFAEADPAEIDDPFMLAEPLARESYRQLSRALDGLAKLL